MSETPIPSQPTPARVISIIGASGFIGKHLLAIVAARKNVEIRVFVHQVLNVIEHLANPVEFLSLLGGHAEHYLFHFPFDLSPVSVLREMPVLHVGRNVGHLHIVGLFTLEPKTLVFVCSGEKP